MTGTKIRAVLSGAKAHLPTLVALACLVIVAHAAVQWAVAAGLSLGSFVLGVAAGAMTGCLTLWAAQRDSGGAERRQTTATSAEWVSRRASLECERMEADTELSRWATRRTRLECRRLRRDLRETDWKDGSGRGP